MRPWKSPWRMAHHVTDCLTDRDRCDGNNFDKIRK